MTSRDQPQQHGVGGVDSTREALLLNMEAYALEVRDLQAQVAQLTEERDRFKQAFLEGSDKVDRLRARCASLEAVVEAARGIALRQSPAHQALRQALAALNATTTQEGMH